MIYDIRVYPKISDGQQYVETVEALTAHDAICMVQRRNPDCLLQCERSYNEPRGSSAISDAGDAMGWIILLGIIFTLWLLIQYWYIAVPVSAFVIIAMLLEKFKD
tara:strand:- start:1257 stop:1571 length:315 start_codon:yes stop_codon:yes gene_type:complete